MSCQAIKSCTHIYGHEYIHRLVYPYLFSCSVSWENIETTAQDQRQHLVQIGFSNTVLQKIPKDTWKRKRLILRQGQEIRQSWSIFWCPKVKKYSKIKQSKANNNRNAPIDEGMSKGYMCQLKEVPMARAGKVELHNKPSATQLYHKVESSHSDVSKYLNKQINSREETYLCRKVAIVYVDISPLSVCCWA